MLDFFCLKVYNEEKRKGKVMATIFNTFALFIYIIISIIIIGYAYLCMYMLPVSRKIELKS